MKKGGLGPCKAGQDLDMSCLPTTPQEWTPHDKDQERFCAPPGGNSGWRGLSESLDVGELSARQTLEEKFSVERPRQYRMACAALREFLQETFEGPHMPCGTIKLPHESSVT